MHETQIPPPSADPALPVPEAAEPDPAEARARDEARKREERTATIFVGVLVAVVFLVGALGASYQQIRGAVVRQREPAFAEALTHVGARPDIHAGILWNTDGGGEYRAAGRALCASAGGIPGEPVSAETLAYYVGGYDDLGVNPPPVGARPIRVGVPMPWTEYAVVSCRQAARTVYFLLGYASYGLGPSNSEVGVAYLGEQGWIWYSSESPASPAEMLTRRRLAEALASFDHDSRPHGERLAFRIDLSVPDRLGGR